MAIELTCFAISSTMGSEMGVYLPLEQLEFGFWLLSASLALLFGFQDLLLSGRRFVSCAIVDLDMEMFTGNEGTKVWYGYDMLRTTSIASAAACHVSSASMSGVHNRGH
jgi:hypothetical protein